MTTEEAVTHVADELKKDPAYWISWQANIAMSFYDAANQYKLKSKKHYLTMTEIHIIANNAANAFLTSLCRK